jgi:hypothetical protein
MCAKLEARSKAASAERRSAERRAQPSEILKLKTERRASDAKTANWPALLLLRRPLAFGGEVEVAAAAIAKVPRYNGNENKPTAKQGGDVAYNFVPFHYQPA